MIEDEDLDLEETEEVAEVNFDSGMIRIIERKVGSKWLLLRMDELEEGDTFRMMEHDQTPVRLGRRRNFIVMRGPYIGDDGYWTVDAGVPLDVEGGS